MKTKELAAKYTWRSRVSPYLPTGSSAFRTLHTIVYAGSNTLPRSYSTQLAKQKARADSVQSFTSHQSPLTIRVHPRFPFHLSGGTLTVGGECPHERVIDSFPVHLCPADHSGLSRSRLFKLRYPAPVPIPILQLRAKMLPSTRLREGL
jgi:hypothetical protein